QETVGGLHVDGELVPPGLGTDLRVRALDPQGELDLSGRRRPDPAGPPHVLSRRALLPQVRPQVGLFGRRVDLLFVHLVSSSTPRLRRTVNEPRGSAGPFARSDCYPPGFPSTCLPWGCTGRASPFCTPSAPDHRPLDRP